MGNGNLQAQEEENKVWGDKEREPEVNLKTQMGLFWKLRAYNKSLKPTP